jgi:hypothetical protein
MFPTTILYMDPEVDVQVGSRHLGTAALFQKLRHERLRRARTKNPLITFNTRIIRNTHGWSLLT